MIKKCKHNFDLIKDYRIESAASEMIKLGLSLETGRGRGILELFRTKLILVYKCMKCHKIKESVFSNIEHERRNN